ncbi:MAG: hypothetical protein EU539_08595 [Promethearchaeota archaeon]|nr:MAG: hypothetical protein EU539_08595 [Candidatus Lokiarchaeota archaeon]
MKIKKADGVFIVLIFVLTLVSVIFSLNPSYQEIIENVSEYESFQNLGTGLLIAFWVCLIGNLSPLPTPYTWIVCFSSSPFVNQNAFIPLLVGFIASLGCLVGEMGGYIFGRGTARILSEESAQNLRKLERILTNHPKLAPLLIFLFGLTPLNDDLLIVPLGIIEYNAKKTIFFCWLGKFGLMLIFAYNLLNICSLIGGESWIISIMSLYVMVIMMYLFIRVDILKFLFNEEKIREEIK